MPVRITQFLNGDLVDFLFSFAFISHLKSQQDAGTKDLKDGGRAIFLLLKHHQVPFVLH